MLMMILYTAISQWWKYQWVSSYLSYVESFVYTSPWRQQSDFSYKKIQTHYQFWIAFILHFLFYFVLDIIFNMLMSLIDLNFSFIVYFYRLLSEQISECYLNLSLLLNHALYTMYATCKVFSFPLYQLNGFLTFFLLLVILCVLFPIPVTVYVS